MESDIRPSTPQPPLAISARAARQLRPLSHKSRRVRKGKACRLRAPRSFHSAICFTKRAFSACGRPAALFAMFRLFRLSRPRLARPSSGSPRRAARPPPGSAPAAPGPREGDACQRRSGGQWRVAPSAGLAVRTVLSGAKEPAFPTCQNTGPHDPKLTPMNEPSKAKQPGLFIKIPIVTSPKPEHAAGQ